MANFVSNWLRAGEKTESGYVGGRELTSEEWCLHEVKRLSKQGLRSYVDKKTDVRGIVYVAVRLRKEVV